ncbi:hypothetical protein O181_059404 [Austropuccinia psidii MF-1]|uniref:Uncharacterized protein n=1 Tax=Austropuccinia psidii MF-1 TaxID=1389203 RepID=A0A9Q3EE78_9BASI|nr:hypothetical protein [Austropuccinia psidii MF-1]
MRPSPNTPLRQFPMVTSQQLQPVASSSRTREYQWLFLFPAAQVSKRRECWPVWVTREDPNMANEGQDGVARIFRRVDRNSRVVNSYANDRIIPGTASEKMAARFLWYYELINDFQRTFDYLGRDN